MNLDNKYYNQTKSKYCMIIELDREKIRHAGYDFDEIQALVDKICTACGSIKVNEFVYAGRGTDSDCATMGRIVKHLKKNKWFWDSVKVWQLKFPNDLLDLDREYRNTVA